MSAPILPVPAVNAAILNKEGKILLTRRSAVVREPGKWCLPGGHLDGGETWEAAMVREVREEVGLVVLKSTLLGVYSDPALTVTQDVLPKGHRAQFVVVVYVVTDFEGEVAPNSEVDEWGWFAKGELPSPMLKSHPVRADDAFSFRGEPFSR